MARSRHSEFLAAAAFVVLAVLAGGLRAQSRVDVNIRTPGGLPTSFGSSTSVFVAHSYGLGGLATPQSPAANVLRSSIESRAIYTVRSSSAPPGAVGAPVTSALPQRGTGVYQPVFNPLGYMPGSELGGPVYSAVPASALNAAADYLAAIGAPAAPQTGTDLITSMAPREEGALSDHMAKGEKAFREGDYEAALRHFQKANAIDSRNPETLLSLAHTHFASAGGAYYRTSYYLRKALRYLPELPLAALDPKSFFGDQAQYRSQLARLEDRLKRFPSDADACLTLAYFRWFDQDVDGARQALAQARRLTKSPDMIEAIQTFWDGMTASGKVSGEPSPTSRPAVAASPSPASPQGLPGAQPPSNAEAE